MKTDAAGDRPMLTFGNIRKSYDRIVALDDLSLEIRSGEIVRLSPEDRSADIRVEHPDLETVFLNLTGRTLRD